MRRSSGQGRDPCAARVEDRFDESSLLRIAAVGAALGERSACEVGGQRRDDLDRLARQRMREGAGAWRAGTGAPGRAAPRRVAVLGIAAHRVADRLQVHADLVGAPRVQAQAQQRGVPERALEREVGARLARAASPPTAMRVRTRGSRPIGASIVPCAPAGGPRRAPGTRARSAARRARACSSAVSLLASARRRAGPEVSRSRRCTIPARSRIRRRPRRRPSSCASVPSRCPRAGCTTRPAALSTTSRCSSS